MKRLDVAVVGAGASGMVAAIALARTGQSVALIERQNRGGKKILASGNGHCNIANTRLSHKNFYTTNQKLIQELLRAYPLERIESFFQSIGLEFTAKDDGRLFPQSMSAASVLNLLEAAMENVGVSRFYGVEDLQVTKNFTLLFANERLSVENIVLATGSEAAPQLGGNCSGLALAKSFGHTIKKSLPALVPLTSELSVCKTLGGLRVPVNITLFAEGKEVTAKSGDLLFTKYGVSGLAILDISIEAVKALSAQKRCELSIDFFKEYSKKELLEYLKKRVDKKRNLALSLWLGAMVHPKLANELLRLLQLENKKESTLKASELKALVQKLKAFTLPISSYRPLQYAEVAMGGVAANEIDSKTLQSLKRPGLYFCGEVLDVIGDRGGYNFYFAWSSALRVAESIVQKEV